MKQAFPAALRATAPILPAYLFIGTAFGLLMVRSGFAPVWPMLMSLTVFAGSMQFIAIDFLIAGVGAAEMFLVTLAANLRHVFYGLSMVDKYRGEGPRKPYLIFALTDETYSLLCTGQAPEGVEPGRYRFLVSLLDQLYWLGGTLLGVVAGGLITFDTTGIDFAMTALFLVICVEQWLTLPRHISAVVGGACAVVCLLVLGPERFMVPALALMTGILLLLRRHLEDNPAQKEESSC